MAAHTNQTAYQIGELQAGTFRHQAVYPFDGHFAYRSRARFNGFD